MASGGALTILLVEDEVLIRLSLAEYLADCGYNVVEASNGQQAIELLQSGSFLVDLVFSDVKMPGDIDGFALARWVADHKPEIPVLLGSGHVGEVQIAEQLCNAGHILAKPYDLDQVVSRIQLTLRQEPA